MFDWRTVLLGCAAFAATFAGGLWFGVGNLPTLVGLSANEVRQPRAAAGTLAVTSAPRAPSSGPSTEGAPTQATAVESAAPTTVAAVARPARFAAPAPPAGKGLTDDRLRREVILRAKAYLKPSCNSDPVALYVAAASKYAEVLMRSAGCSQFPRCRISEGFLNEAWRANRSTLDQPVADAMAEVHSAGGLSEKSFRGDVGRAVRVIAARDFAEAPAPECDSGTKRRTKMRWRR
jgi:hypothetical protein